MIKEFNTYAKVSNKEHETIKTSYKEIRKD